METEEVSDFEPAVEHTLSPDVEGGYSDDPADHGGPTNMGITLATLKAALGKAADLNGDGRVDAEDVKLLPRSKAIGIYRLAYWDRPGFGEIPDQAVATKAFDLAVHAGPHASIVLLQRAIDHAKPAFVPAIADDGVLGPKTLATLAQCDRDVLLGAMCSEQASFYLRVIEHDPSQARFKAGWLERARWKGEDVA